MTLWIRVERYINEIIYFTKVAAQLMMGFFDVLTSWSHRSVKHDNCWQVLSCVMCQLIVELLNECELGRMPHGAKLVEKALETSVF